MGVDMRTSPHFHYFIFVCALLTGCASSETRSIVSKNDIPANKYQKIALFVEESDSSLRPSQTITSVQIAGGAISLVIPTGSTSASAAEIEQNILSALGSAGVAASSGTSLFKGKELSEKTKALIVQKDYQAVLYVTIEHGSGEERVDASHDGVDVTFGTGVVKSINDLGDRYRLKPDGSVYFVHPIVKMKSDLQDTKTNKLVWSAETIASGGPAVVSSRASDELVAKMRADGAI